MTAAWNHFWFEPRSTRALCLLRIAFGFTFILRTMTDGGFQAPSRVEFHLLRWNFSSPERYFLDGFRLPAPGFGWLPVPSFEHFRWIEIVIFSLAVLLVLGLFTRVVAPALALLLCYTLLLSQFFYYHHYWTFVSVFAILAFSDCGQHYSLDALLFRRGRPCPDRSVAPIRMIQVLVSNIYLFTFLAKCNSGWWSGEIMTVFGAERSIDDFWGAIILGWVSPRFLSMFTLFSEAFLSFGFWIPRLRWLALVVGLALHVGIDLLMDVRTYSLQMFAIYIVCMVPVHVGTRVERRAGLSGVAHMEAPQERIANGPTCPGRAARAT